LRLFSFLKLISLTFSVRWENIDRDSKGQFLKEQPADVDTGSVPYDLGSIMHYRSKAFAQFDDLFTLSTFITDYQRTIGQRDQLSFNDIRLMNTIYCKNTGQKQLPCQRGGYPDPRKTDRCSKFVRNFEKIILLRNFKKQKNFLNSNFELLTHVLHFSGCPDGFTGKVSIK
jgi:hypothetical protein